MYVILITLVGMECALSPAMILNTECDERVIIHYGSNWDKSVLTFMTFLSKSLDILVFSGIIQT